MALAPCEVHTQCSSFYPPWSDGNIEECHKTLSGWALHSAQSTFILLWFKKNSFCAKRLTSLLADLRSAVLSHLLRFAVDLPPPRSDEITSSLVFSKDLLALWTHEALVRFDSIFHSLSFLFFFYCFTSLFWISLLLFLWNIFFSSKTKQFLYLPFSQSGDRSRRTPLLANETQGELTWRCCDVWFVTSSQ